MAPDVGSSIPISRFEHVLFPLPVGPVIPTRAPWRIVRQTLGSAKSCDPYEKATPSKTISRSAGEFRRSFGLVGGQRRLRERDHVDQRLQIAGRVTPSDKRLLDERQQALSGERQRAQRGDGLRNPARLEAECGRDQGKCRHGRSFHNEAGRRSDKQSGRLSLPIAAVEAPELLLEKRLGTIQDDVTESRPGFPERLDSRFARRRDDDRVASETPARGKADGRVDAGCENSAAKVAIIALMEKGE